MENKLTIQIKINYEDTKNINPNIRKSISLEVLTMPTTYEAFIDELAELAEIDLIEGKFLIFFGSKEVEKLTVNKDNYNMILKKVVSKRSSEDDSYFFINILNKPSIKIQNDNESNYNFLFFKK